ncbi:hypothetical protein ES705_49983 [subsurface metagenome]
MGLKDKLKQDIQSKEKAQVDWRKRKEDWIYSVNELNQLITDWFSDFKAEGLVEFKTTEKTHTEEYIGSYKVNVLHLCFVNGKEIIIEPMGTLIIGAWARFDVYARGYNSGKYYILRYKDEEGNFTWNIANPENKRNVEPLTKVTLEQIFEKWLS